VVQIGELSYRVRFDARELSKGMLSSRQQLAAAKKLLEESKTPQQRYADGLQNLAEMSKRFTHVAERQVEISKQLEKQYLTEESAIRKLTRAEKARLELLQLPDAIRARSTGRTGQDRAARDASNRRAGLQRQSFLQGISDQEAAGRAALQGRLAARRAELTARDAAMSGVGVNRADAMAAYGRFDASRRTQLISNRDQSARDSRLIGRPAVSGGRGRFGAAAATAIGISAAYGAVEFGRQSIMKVAEIEDAATAFRVLTGSMTQAERIMTEIRVLSARGLSFSGLSQAAQTMLGFGVTAQKVMPMLRSFADITGGDTDRLKQLALAFGQVTAAGRLTGQETLQFINAGFNPLKTIADETGQSMRELRDQMSEGAITVQAVESAFIKATSKGGMFFGMLDEKSKTVGGLLRNVSAAIESMQIELGTKLSPAFASTVDSLLEAGKLIGENAWLIEKAANALGFTISLYRDAADAIRYVTGDKEAGKNGPLYHANAYLDLLDRRQKEQNARREKEQQKQEIKQQEEEVRKSRERRDAIYQEMMNSGGGAGAHAMLGQHAVASMDVKQAEQRLRDLQQSYGMTSTSSAVTSAASPSVSSAIGQVTRPQLYTPPATVTQDQAEYQNRLKIHEEQRQQQMKARDDARQAMLDDAAALRQKYSTPTNTSAADGERRKQQLNTMYQAGQISFDIYNREWNMLEQKLNAASQAANPMAQQRPQSPGVGADLNSQEHVRWVAEMMNAKGKTNPNAKLEQQGEQQLAEMREQNRKLDKLADTSPRRVA